MKTKEIREKISEGHLHIRTIVEIAGKPKEYVEETLTNYVKKIKKNKNHVILSEDPQPAEEKEGFFSAFTELEMLVKSPSDLLSFCFDYMPASVEIMEPENMRMKSTDLSDFINDLQARLHSLNTAMIQNKDKNKLYIQNTAVLLRNFLIVLLSYNTLSLEEIVPYMGIKKEGIQRVLAILIKEGKIKRRKTNSKQL